MYVLIGDVNPSCKFRHATRYIRLFVFFLIRLSVEDKPSARLKARLSNDVTDATIRIRTVEIADEPKSVILGGQQDKVLCGEPVVTDRW